MSSGCVVVCVYCCRCRCVVVVVVVGVVIVVVVVVVGLCVPIAPLIFQMVLFLLLRLYVYVWMCACTYLFVRLCVYYVALMRGGLFVCVVVRLVVCVLFSRVVSCGVALSFVLFALMLNRICALLLFSLLCLYVDILRF